MVTLCKAAQKVSPDTLVMLVKGRYIGHCGLLMTRDSPSSLFVPLTKLGQSIQEICPGHDHRQTDGKRDVF